MQHDEMGDPTLRDGRDGEWWRVAMQVRASLWVLRGRLHPPPRMQNYKASILILHDPKFS